VEAGAITRSEPLPTIADAILGLVGHLARDLGRL
jgi:hypothetical protein